MPIINVGGDLYDVPVHSGDPIKLGPRDFTDKALKALRSCIMERLLENSGGMKFVQLLVDVTAASYKDTDVPHVDPEELEIELKKMPNVKILTYGYPMSSTITREKMFVYIPL